MNITKKAKRDLAELAEKERYYGKKMGLENPRPILVLMYGCTYRYRTAHDAEMTKKDWSK